MGADQNFLFSSQGAFYEAQTLLSLQAMRKHEWFEKY